MSESNGILGNIQKQGAALTNTVSEGLSNVQKSAGDTFNNIKSSAESTYSGVQNKINEFSSSSAAPGASSSFFDANGLIAKFAFLILAIIVFLILLNLGIRILYYFMNPQSYSVYVVDGMIDGNAGFIFSQDPKQNSSLIMRSNNQTTGIEFSWSVWLKLDGFPTSTNTAKFLPIFIKGVGPYNGDTGILNGSNGPGLYFSSGINPAGNQANSLRIMMDTVQTPISTIQVNKSPQIIDISNIPIKKWFHVLVRCQNKYLDVYINGIVVYRTNLNNVPLQNDQNVSVCTNNGFTGKLSNLIYYNRALNIVDINNIVSSGPNTKNANPSKGVYGGDYLSTLWYPTS